MQKEISAYKKNILEKIKPEFTQIEEYGSRRQAEKRKMQCRRQGLYFTFSIQEEGKWRVYIG